MRPRQYSDSEVSRLQDIISSDRPIRLIAHVSNGPWYGFNGVQVLVLTDQALYRVQASKFAFRRDVVLDKVVLSDLSDARWIARRDSGRISFRVAGVRKSYVSKWTEATDLAKALTDRPALRSGSVPTP